MLLKISVMKRNKNNSEGKRKNKMYRDSIYLTVSH